MSNPAWKPAEIRQSCIPYVVLPGNAAEFIQLLKDAFGATENLRHARPDGSVMHCEMLMDDTSLMLADAPPEMTVAGHAQAGIGARPAAVTFLSHSSSAMGFGAMPIH
jgi:uncharacterized glyoxalase superfamily protein PhnB